MEMNTAAFSGIGISIWALSFAERITFKQSASWQHLSQLKADMLCILLKGNEYT